VAQYNAVTAADDEGHGDGTLPDKGSGPGGRRRYEAERGAVAGASWLVLRQFFPAASSALAQRVHDEGNAGPGGTHPQFTRGLGVGMEMARNMIARLSRDHFTDPWTGTVPVGPGKWIANGPPSGPVFGTVTPYFLTSGSQFRPAPPAAFGSAAFLADLAEIRTLSDTRTPEQLAITRFWDSPAGTPTPPGYWNEVAGGFIAQYRLNERAATHVLSLTHASIMDAFIGCWEAKYYYWLIRPSQTDPAITLPIGLPNHPSYPSGHSCQSGAAATVLTHFFPAHGSDLASRVTEAGLSRMYAGIHYRFDITAGQTLGRSVAEFAIGVDRSRGMLAAIR
jgi:membrane-associated phospholipid phosphatase